MSLQCPIVGRSFSDERGPGTFHSLGSLPKRKSHLPSHKPPIFHIAHNDDDDDDNHSASSDDHVVPFPRASPPPSPLSSSPPPSTLSPPRLTRGRSTPIPLSNGKPLKSSLKSSSSSPAMLSPPHHLHLRARSEPSTPATTPKNVHFPDKDYALATVRFFNCKARPAALSSPSGNSNGDETETEGEDTPSACFPFPRVPPLVKYEIDPTKSTIAPSKLSPHANLHLESLDLSSSSGSTTLILTGSILVRNLAFEKNVAIRFTLDDWQTVSEVSAHYAKSLSSLPSHLSPSPSPSVSPSSSSMPSSRKDWDRFTFAIHLEDYSPSLCTRTMWFAARFRVTSTYPLPGSTECGPGGEWWDNNAGKNYCARFRPAAISATPLKDRPPHETISASVTSPPNQLKPPVACKEQAFGLMIPSLKGTEPLYETRRPPVPLQVGRLSLCNYVPPKVHTLSSIPYPSTNSVQDTSPTSAHPVMAPSAICQLSSDEESISPASSALSTPTISPTIPPRMIIGGQPATYSDGKGDDVVMSSRPVHIADWEWSALNQPRVERLAQQPADILSVSNVLSSSRKGRDDPLYDAFISQWCFAQGPSPNHNS